MWGKPADGFSLSICQRSANPLGPWSAASLDSVEFVDSLATNKETLIGLPNLAQTNKAKVA